jgi:16S rRNA (guanine966-N2)-methyltransferase
MRIIGGDAKGRRLHSPRGCRIRPTSDKIKEALFNLLTPVLGKSFLDLFAGSGSVGIEALSRGAARAVFVEHDPALAELIRRNIEECGFERRAEVFATDVQSGLRRLLRKHDAFDIIFADPPYGQAMVSQIIALLGKGSLLSGEGLIIIQHSVRETSWQTGFFMLTDRRRYGETILSFLKLS